MRLTARVVRGIQLANRASAGERMPREFWEAVTESTERANEAQALADASIAIAADDSRHAG